MDVNTYHNLNHLFDQLGLPSDDASISQFIVQHKPLSPEIELMDAPWWSKSQADFLREVMNQDADWVMVIDQLNEKLR